MSVDIREVLINCAAAFGTGVLWYELTKKLFNLDSEDEDDVSSGDRSFYIFAVDAEEAKDDKPIYVMRKLKGQKTKN